MKNIVTFFLFVYASTVFSKAMPYGVWRFPGTLVFIEVLENGAVFQCRIDTDGSAIMANGIFDGDRIISWEPVEVIDKDGNPKEVTFSWQHDEVVVTDNAIKLSGPYGSFSFLATTENFRSYVDRNS